MSPANTPVALPRNPVGSIPARSNASQDNSSNIRCCGSIANASLGEIPKNAGSKSATPSTKPPVRAYDLWRTSGSGSNNPARSHPRSVGNSDITSLASATICHSPSGESTPPGKRHDMPTIAIGSLERSSNARLVRFRRSTWTSALRSASVACWS
ncbi:Uncharacterised protein [Mycobacterium tuberculosis]|uniref:Uncharacterized protein n=1 Tax=Mycobacterium tuberculosis TaxID=1773 RepID=A0A0T9FH13_MYCTX|nr:hypothetical protein FI98_02507 [Mycobacterium tuberculosis]CEZ69338.1 Uncharacterised protein [Mycobacterium tuberculosis]CFC80216.1 Uncharacterised protein [Mycobacterium tuberculosis]CFD24687.1 Uncharacterised protein [Mycobacterium tuberculosis]CFE43347.1 Uncharacterised protein [Mycobacterium tuberculosis]